jgi:hypothetical protein
MHWCQTSFVQLHKGQMVMNGFRALIISCHLLGLLFEITLAKCLLHEVNVKQLRLFHIIIVSCTKKYDRSLIVTQDVHFWKVEVFPNSKIQKDFFILMKLPCCNIQSIECVIGMNGILS